jgi:hypothetical protein
MDAHDWDNETMWWTDFRNCVIGITDEAHEMDPAEAERIAALVDAVRLDPHGGAEEITSLALALARCPLHLRDYAICAEDQDPECAAIRAVHPDSGRGRRANTMTDITKGSEAFLRVARPGVSRGQQRLCGGGSGSI